MDTPSLLEHLTEAAERLGIRIRATKGNFQGGRCTVEGTPTIVLNTRHSPERRLYVLARALQDAPLETLYLKPAVRDALQALWDDLEEDVPDRPSAQTAPSATAPSAGAAARSASSTSAPPPTEDADGHA